MVESADAVAYPKSRPRLAPVCGRIKHDTGAMVRQPALDSRNELAGRGYFELRKRDSHPALRQLDCQRRGNREPVCRHVDQKQIASLDNGRPGCDAREHGGCTCLRGVAIERLW